MTSILTCRKIFHWSIQVLFKAHLSHARVPSRDPSERGTYNSKILLLNNINLLAGHPEKE